MSVENKRLEQWRAWSQEAAHVEKWARENQADKLAQASSESILAAEARLSRSPRGAKGLGELCISSDAPQALGALMDKTFWMAAVCQAEEDWREFASKMALSAVEAKSVKCLVWLCSKNPGLAWSMASHCAPDVGRLARERGGSIWSEGFIQTVAIAIKEGGLIDEQKAAKALAAVERVLSGPSVSKALIRCALGAAEHMMSMQPARLQVQGVLLRVACAQGEASVAAWDLHEKLFASKPISAQPTSWFGFEAGRRQLRGSSSSIEGAQPFVVYPGLLDPAWVAAANAVDENGTRLAREMARRSKADPESRPRLYPSVAALTHPLSSAWEIWNHSNRAGYALPKKPLDLARQRMRESLDQWEARVGEAAIETWRRVGEDMFASLYAGHVPSAFPGLASKPKIDQAEKNMSRQLAPLAWRHHAHPRSMEEETFVACARASEALGMELSDYTEQARGILGLELDSVLIAKAECALLSDLVSGPAEARKGALRM
jgi:hypothetical protein